MWLYVKTVYEVKHLINIDHVADVRYEEGLNQTAIVCSLPSEIIRVHGNQIPNIREYIVQRAENGNRHAVCRLGNFND